MQIALHELGDDVGVVACAVDVVEVEDVFGGGEGFQGGDLVLEEHLVDGVLELGHLDYFQTHLLSRAVPLALMHCAAVALADPLAYLI